jgi:hypothetical protein
MPAYAKKPLLVRNPQIDQLGAIEDVIRWARQSDGAVGEESGLPRVPSGSPWYISTDAGKVRFHDGTGWIIMAETSVSWTPTLTNITLGTGASAVITGWYHRSDGYVDFHTKIQFGIAPIMVSGAAISLPFLPSSGDDLENVMVTFSDQAPTLTRYIGGLRFNASNGADLFYLSLSPLRQVVVDSSNPFSLAVNDVIRIAGRYRMANRYQT